MNKWYNAKAIQPPDGKEVLGACFDEGLLFHNIVVFDSRDGGQWTLVSNETIEMDVRLWMELPSLPKLF